MLAFGGTTWLVKGYYAADLINILGDLFIDLFVDVLPDLGVA